MSMFLASSLSYDVVIISCAMLLFALLLRFYEHDSISKWEMSLLAFVAFNLMICKSSFYATLLLILLPFLTKNRKRCIKQILLLVTTLIIGALTKLMFHYLSSATTDAIISSTNQILQAQQKTYLLGNVDQLIPIVLNTVKSSYRFWYISMTGCLGNLNINIVIPFLFLYTLSIFGSAVCEGFNYPYRLKWEKLATVLILLIEISALIIYMYLQWTPLVSELYGDISTGVQGRYFIPFLPFLLLIFANRFSFKRVKRLQGYVPLLSIGIGSLMAVISIIVVFLKCYIPL